MGWRGRSSAATVSLRGGELRIGSDGITNGGSGDKVVKLEGGKLSSAAGWGTTVPVTLGGPVTVDTSGGDIALGGGITGKGVLAKIGTGVLELAGRNAFDGIAEVKGGVLRVGDAPNTAVRVSSGGVISAAKSANLKALELERGSASEFTIGSSSAPLVISHSGGFRVLGSHTIHLAAGPGAATGTFTLIRYSGAIGGAGFNNLTLGRTPGLKARLVNNTASSSIDLQITAVEMPQAE